MAARAARGAGSACSGAAGDEAITRPGAPLRPPGARGPPVRTCHKVRVVSLHFSSGNCEPRVTERRVSERRSDFFASPNFVGPRKPGGGADGFLLRGSGIRRGAAPDGGSDRGRVRRSNTKPRGTTFRKGSADPRGATTCISPRRFWPLSTIFRPRRHCLGYGNPKTRAGWTGLFL